PSARLYQVSRRFHAPLRKVSRTIWALHQSVVRFFRLAVPGKMNSERASFNAWNGFTRNSDPNLFPLRLCCGTSNTAGLARWWNSIVQNWKASGLKLVFAMPIEELLSKIEAFAARTPTVSEDIDEILDHIVYITKRQFDAALVDIMWESKQGHRTELQLV